MQEIKLYDDKFRELIRGQIRGAILEPRNEEEERVEEVQPLVIETPIDIPKILSCSYCNAEFANVDQQREHYKLDWHRYNLKQSLLSRPAIAEQQFNEKSDDLSSISGSDSEKEDTLDILATSLGKVFLKDETGRVFSIYRALLVDRKIDIDMSEIQKQLQSIHSKNQWAIFMLGGGHFAGAVFQGENPVLHKTFHCYTVRAGQGGAQSGRDNKSATSAPKSAGASMRRYNEQAFVTYVSNIMEAWQKEIGACSLIFYRAAGTYNKSVLFGGKIPLLDKSDNRLRSIPFSTRRATFTEVKRVHSLLSTVSVFDKLENASKHITKYKPAETKRSKTKTSPINRAKSREIVERPLPGEGNLNSDEENTQPNKPNDNNESSDESVKFETSNLEISFQECLGSFEETRRPKNNKKEPKKKKSKTQKLQEAETLRKKELCDVISKGNLDVLKNILKTYEENDGKINEPLDSEQNTLMHLSCIKNQKEILLYLLELGADVCAKNKSHQTPYSCMQIKDMREVLKEYAKDNPDKYNYNKAQIPIIIVNQNSEEIAEKKRLQKKLKREKEKEKKKEKDVQRKEEVEQNKFAALSDREKRALAAERRILSQAGTVVARCFLCGADISGKVPFEYSGNRFCTMECLKAHRIKSPVVLS